MLKEDSSKGQEFPPIDWTAVLVPPQPDEPEELQFIGDEPGEITSDTDSEPNSRSIMMFGRNNEVWPTDPFGPAS